MIPSSMKQTTQKIPSYLKEYLTQNQKQKLYETSWDDIEASQNLDEAYKSFLNKFSDLYDTYL